jgi:hypothetical protein
MLLISNIAVLPKNARLNKSYGFCIVKGVCDCLVWFLVLVFGPRLKVLLLSLVFNNIIIIYNGGLLILGKFKNKKLQNIYSRVLIASVCLSSRRISCILGELRNIADNTLVWCHNAPPTISFLSIFTYILLKIKIMGRAVALPGPYPTPPLTMGDLHAFLMLDLALDIIYNIVMVERLIWIVNLLIFYDLLVIH